MILAGSCEKVMNVWGKCRGGFGCDMLWGMETAVADFANELRRRVAGDLRTDLTAARSTAPTPASTRRCPWRSSFPRQADDIQAAVELAAQYKVPVLPRAGGSSLAGQAVNEAVVIDTSRYLDRILEMNAEERWVRVQPGIVLDTLNDALRPHGLQFGPDPASSNRAGLGGIVSNNATGSHSILYGMAVDHVLEMKVILADGGSPNCGRWTPRSLPGNSSSRALRAPSIGSIAALVDDEHNRQAIRAGTPRHWRRCGGYNLARFLHDGTIDHYLPQDQRFNLVNLLCGAEGTLAAITEIKLNLVPRPTADCPRDRGISHAAGVAGGGAGHPGDQPAAVELIDDLSLTMAAEKPESGAAACRASSRASRFVSWRWSTTARARRSSRARTDRG